MYMIGFPLLLIPLAIINIFVFLMPGVVLTAPVVHVRLMSNEVWALTFSDVLIALGVLLLIVEVGKAARAGAKLVFDHFMSMLVLGVALAEFLMLKPFANSTMFVICTLCVADVVASLAVQMRRRMSAKVPRSAKTEIVPQAAPAPDIAVAPMNTARQEPVIAQPPVTLDTNPYSAAPADAYEAPAPVQSVEAATEADPISQTTQSMDRPVPDTVTHGNAGEPVGQRVANEGLGHPQSSSLDDAIADLRTHRVV